MEVKILHESCLEKCSSADDQGKKDWRKRYFVFKHFPASSTRCLEYYKDKHWRKQDPKGVLTLHPGYEVVKVHDSKRKYVFDVKTLEHVFRLSAHSEDELNSWILILEKENIVKSFVVEPVPGDVMDKTGAKDTCHLHVTDTEVRLILASNGNQLVAWPFTCLRRYMSTRGKFSLEAGRRAPTGQGTFVFITLQHDEIYKLLDNVIKSRAGNSVPAAPLQSSTKSQRSEPIQSTDTIVEEDGYDHLMCSPLAGVKPAHQNHPNYDQNVLKSPYKTETQSSNDYASPYSHMRSHESLTSLKEHKDVDMIQSGDAKGDYHTLDHDTMAHNTLQSNTGKVHDILNPSMPQKPPPPLPPNSDWHLQCEKLDERGNCTSSQLYDNKHSPQPSDTTNTYDSLDHPPSLQIPARIRIANTFDKMKHGSIEADEDAYNVLSYPGSPVSSPVVKSQQSVGDASQNVANDYCKLDRPNIPQHTTLHHTRSQPSVTPKKPEISGRPIPVPPPRVPRGGNDRISQGYDRSSVSSVSSVGSSVCPLDMSGSYRHSQLSMSPDQDFYSSIDEGSISPTKVQPLPTYKGVPNTRTGSESPSEPKQIAPKPRKARTQEHKDTEQDNQQKHRQSGLVSNLKASLIADGLNLKKIIPGRHGNRRFSADAIQENDTYAEVDDGGSKEKGFNKTRLVRSPSAPMDPIEDIYEDPDQTSYR